MTNYRIEPQRTASNLNWAHWPRNCPPCGLDKVSSTG